MIYFVTARDIGRVKIGFSEDPRNRFVKIRADSPVPLALERICEGDVEVERAIHAMFEHHRVVGEWFSLSDEVELFMLTLDEVVKAEKKVSLNKKLQQIGLSQAYASQAISGKKGHRITIPMAVAVYRKFGDRVGPLEDASDHEIDVLEKFCGSYGQAKVEAA